MVRVWVWANGFLFSVFSLIFQSTMVSFGSMQLSCIYWATQCSACVSYVTDPAVVVLRWIMTVNGILSLNDLYWCANAWHFWYCMIPPWKPQRFQQLNRSWGKEPSKCSTFCSVGFVAMGVLSVYADGSCRKFDTSCMKTNKQILFFLYCLLMLFVSSNINTETATLIIRPIYSATDKARQRQVHGCWIAIDCIISWSVAWAFDTVRYSMGP